MLSKTEISKCRSLKGDLQLTIEVDGFVIWGSIGRTVWEAQGMHWARRFKNNTADIRGLLPFVHVAIWPPP